MTQPGKIVCASCGTEVAPNLLVCPTCNALIHSARLKSLAAEADRAYAAGDLSKAIGQWRLALELLPEGTRQYAAVNERISTLGRQVDAQPAAPKTNPDQPWWQRGWAVIGAGVVFLLTKAKFLLLGLSKASTLLSMLVFVGVYWAAFGWKWALGIAVGMYIHEMGHVAALRRYGIDATAPMFIPGVGAFIRAKQHIADPRHDARVGLAGPLWGLGASLAAYGMGLATGAPVWYAIAHINGFINLFNLVAWYPLDGGRGFRALDRGQRVIASLVIGLAWYASQQGILILLLALAVLQVFQKGPEEPDNGTLATYSALVIILAWLSGIQVATPV